jgi:hypothetical protein
VQYNCRSSADAWCSLSVPELVRPLDPAAAMELDSEEPKYAQRPDSLRRLRACKTCKLIKTYDQVRAARRCKVFDAAGGAGGRRSRDVRS